MSANNFLLNRSFETRLTYSLHVPPPFIHISENAQALNHNTFFLWISRTFCDTESHEMRLKIRKVGNKNILIYGIFGTWKPNSIDFTAGIFFNFLFYLKAQKTQCAIFTVLSFSICCFLMVLVLIFGIIRIHIRYYSNNLSIRIRIRTKVALRILFVFVFGQISEPE